MTLQAGTRLGLYEILRLRAGAQRRHFSLNQPPKRFQPGTRWGANSLASVWQVLEPRAPARFQVAPRRLDPSEESRVVLEPVIEPIVL